MTDEGTRFSAEYVELNIRNVDHSITDFCVNLDNTWNYSSDDYVEDSLVCLSGPELSNENGSSVVANADGTTTIKLNLKRVYNTFHGNCPDGVDLKIFIESVPDRRDLSDGGFIGPYIYNTGNRTMIVIENYATLKDEFRRAKELTAPKIY